MDFQPMSPDDMQRKMEFLLNQQAQFAADMAAHAAAHATQRVEFDADMRRLAHALMGLTSVVGSVSSQQERTDQQLKELGGYIRTVESNLNAMIATFERHLQDDHGRRPS